MRKYRGARAQTPTCVLPRALSPICPLEHRVRFLVLFFGDIRHRRVSHGMPTALMGALTSRGAKARDAWWYGMPLYSWVASVFRDGKLARLAVIFVTMIRRARNTFSFQGRRIQTNHCARRHDDKRGLFRFSGAVSFLVRRGAETNSSPSGSYRFQAAKRDPSITSIASSTLTHSYPLRFCPSGGRGV